MTGLRRAPSTRGRRRSVSRLSLCLSFCLTLCLPCLPEAHGTLSRDTHHPRGSRGPCPTPTSVSHAVSNQPLWRMSESGGERSRLYGAVPPECQGLGAFSSPGPASRRCDHCPHNPQWLPVLQPSPPHFQPIGRKKKRGKGPTPSFKNTSWKLHTSAYLLLARAVAAISNYLGGWERCSILPGIAAILKHKTPKRGFNKKADTGSRLGHMSSPPGPGITPFHPQDPFHHLPHNLPDNKA